MEDFEKLSNDQIRDRLKKFGLPIIPVTDTTRKTLIRRLVNVAQNGSANADPKPSAKARRETVNVPKYSPPEESDSDADAIKVTKTKQSSSRRATIAAAAERSKPIEKKVLSSLKQTVIQTVNLAENSDDDLVVPAAPPPRIVSRTSRSPSLGKSTIVTTSYKHTIAPLEEQEDIDSINLVNEEESDPEPTEPVLLKPKEVNRRATQLPSLFGGRKEQVIEESASNDSAFRRRFTSYAPPSASSTQIAPDDKRPSVNIDSPFLSDFTRRLAQLKAEPLAGLTTNIEPIASPTTSYKYSEPSREYRSSYLSRSNLERERYERMPLRAGAYEENHWNAVEKKVRWPIFAVLIVFACVFLYVFLFMN